MARILDLVRPEVAFDPETIAVLSAALEEAWDRLLMSGASAPGQPMPALCARLWRGASSTWRNGAPTMKNSLVDGAIRFLAANYRL